MATSRGSNTKRTYLNTGPWWNQEVGGSGQTEGKKRQSYSKQTTRGYLHGSDSKCACAKRSTIGQRKISQLTVIIDNLIKQQRSASGMPLIYGVCKFFSGFLSLNFYDTLHQRMWISVSNKNWWQVLFLFRDNRWSGYEMFSAFI